MPTDSSTNQNLNTHRASQNEIRSTDNDVNPDSSDDNELLQTSTNIFIYSNDAVVGMIQSFSISENRQIKKLHAIGWEGVVQAVPQNTKGGQLNVSRIALYNSSIWNALGLSQDATPYNPLGKKIHEGASPTKDKNSHTSSTGGKTMKSDQVFNTLKDQRVPLEIKVKTKKKGGTDEYYIDRYIDCWLSSYQKSYKVGDVTVGEDVTIDYADIY
jgi:hypothetical protein